MTPSPLWNFPENSFDLVATLPLSWPLLLVYWGVFWGPMRQKSSISICSSIWVLFYLGGVEYL